MKKINITSIILLIYILAIGIWQWPGNQEKPDFIQYFVMLGLSLVVAFLLRLVQIKRLKMRNKWKEERKE